MRRIGSMKQEFFPELRKTLWVLHWKNFTFIGESWKEVMSQGIQKEKEKDIQDEIASNKKEFN